MVLQQKAQNSLQKRVDKYLHDKPTAYVVEEFGEEAVQDISDTLQNAEVNLKAAQEHVDRLKRELVKAQSYFAPETQRPLT
jgi:signal recognition particle GTPase